MSKPIPDKAEIALEYPDKFYVGTFEHTSRFETHLDPTGFALTLTRPAPRTSANRFTCTSVAACSRASCANLLRASAAFRRMISSIANNSWRPSRSCTKPCAGPEARHCLKGSHQRAFDLTLSSAPVRLRLSTRKHLAANTLGCRSLSP